MSDGEASNRRIFVMGSNIVSDTPLSTSTVSPRQGPSAAEVVLLLQTAFPNTWERQLRNYLGDTNPADLPPAEFDRFTDHVFWLVTQTGIKDPAAWLAFRAQLDATVAPVELEFPVENGGIPAQQHTAGPEPTNPARCRRRPPAVAKSRSKNLQRKSRKPTESFRLSACGLSSTVSRNVPSYSKQLAKQASTAKRLNIG
jgi:hypothetical protein